MDRHTGLHMIQLARHLQAVFIVSNFLENFNNKLELQELNVPWRKVFFPRPREEKHRNKITNLYKGGDYESAAVVPCLGKKCEPAQQRQHGSKNYTH